MDTSVGTDVHLHFAAHQCRPSESVEIIVSICCGATGNNLHLLNVHVRLEGSVEKYSTLDSGFIDCLDLVCKGRVFTSHLYCKRTGNILSCKFNECHKLIVNLSAIHSGV